jgi:hypothetical protein
MRGNRGKSSTSAAWWGPGIDVSGTRHMTYYFKAIDKESLQRLFPDAHP